MVHSRSVDRLAGECRAEANQFVVGLVSAKIVIALASLVGNSSRGSFRLEPCPEVLNDHFYPRSDFRNAQAGVRWKCQLRVPASTIHSLEPPSLDFGTATGQLWIDRESGDQ